MTYWFMHSGYHLIEIPLYLYVAFNSHTLKYKAYKSHPWAWHQSKLDLQSIGSSPGLHILCARNTIMIPFTTRTWDSFLRLGGTGTYIWAWNMMPPLGTQLLPLITFSPTYHEELPHVLDLAVHLVYLDRYMLRPWGTWLLPVLEIMGGW